MSDPVPSLAIYDATTAGRAIITAADAAAQRALLSVYSTSQVDGLLSGLGALTAADIDTLAEINAILTDANFATVATTGAYSDLSGLPTLGTAATTAATDYATAAQGSTADSALQPGDIASGTITPRADDIDLSGGSSGDVITVQADGSLALSTPAGGAASPLTLTASVATETPLTVQGAASQSVSLLAWKNSAGTVIGQISKDGFIYAGGGSVPQYPIDVNGRIRCTDQLIMGGSVVVLSRDGSGYTKLNSNVGTIIDSGRAYATNTTAGFVQINAGQSTGNATPAKVTVRTTTPTTSGTTLQTLRDAVEVDGNTTAGETTLLLWDVDAGALVRVSVGAADSGGTGFKLLRIPN